MTIYVIQQTYPQQNVLSAPLEAESPAAAMAAYGLPEGAVEVSTGRWLLPDGSVRAAVAHWPLNSLDADRGHGTGALYRGRA